MSRLVRSLQEFESRNVTYVGDPFPLFWQSASRATVVDSRGAQYVDLTAAFGVANVGHGNPAVAAAIAEQARTLMHAMGDVHPAAVKVALLEKLAAVAPTGLSKTYLATTGTQAVEAAMKTAMLATGRHAFAAFRGGYHGLSFGALAVMGIERFRAPFASAVATATAFFDYPKRGDPFETVIAEIQARLRDRDVAALIVEPMQGRGGCIDPPRGFLRALRETCDEFGTVLIVDEIFTGFGRTGSFFACGREGVVPDILCAGKALGNGFPISAAIAKPTIMDAWPNSEGEALHTSTWLGNPIGCAAALATIEEIERLGAVERAAALGARLGERLRAFRTHPSVRDVRGRGLFWGIEVDGEERAAAVVADALRNGVIALQSGPAGNVVSISPPLVIPEDQLFSAIDVIEGAL